MHFDVRQLFNGRNVIIEVSIELALDVKFEDNDNQDRRYSRYPSKGSEFALESNSIKTGQKMEREIMKGAYVKIMRSCMRITQESNRLMRTFQMR